MAAHRRKGRRVEQLDNVLSVRTFHRPESQPRSLSPQPAAGVESGQLRPDLDSGQRGTSRSRPRTCGSTAAASKSTKADLRVDDARRQGTSQRPADTETFRHELLLDDGRQPPQLGRLPFLGLRSRRPRGAPPSSGCRSTHQKSFQSNIRWNRLFTKVK